MNVREFQAWLDGYMQDRAEPDAALIAEKAREIVDAAPTWQWFPVAPWYEPVPLSPTITQPQITWTDTVTNVAMLPDHESSYSHRFQ